MNTKLLIVGAVSLLALAACGGGGGVVSAPTAAPAAAAPAAPPAAPAAGQAADKYTGTWATACFRNLDGVTLASNGALMFQTRSYTFSPISAAVVSLVWKDTYFAPTDTTCSQASLGNVTRPNTNTATIDGTKVIGANTVDKITPAVALPFPGLSAGTYIFNGVRYPGSYNQPNNGKLIASVTATTLTLGFDSVLDVNGYPTVLDTTPNAILTKQ